MWYDIGGIVYFTVLSHGLAMMKLTAGWVDSYS